MTQFYVSIIFLGIILIIISIILIIFDKQKAHKDYQLFDEKRGDLVKTLSDAEQMLDELNKFSGYVIAQIELKNEELFTNLKTVDAKIEHLGELTEEVNQINIQKSEKAVYSNVVDIRGKVDASLLINNDLVVDSIALNGTGVVYQQPYKQQMRLNDKVIPLNNRSKEVIQLAQRGLSDTEIARRLNIGKGEIQLILGVNK